MESLAYLECENTRSPGLNVRINLCLYLLLQEILIPELNIMKINNMNCLSYQLFIISIVELNYKYKEEYLKKSGFFSYMKKKGPLLYFRGNHTNK